MKQYQKQAVRLASEILSQPEFARARKLACPECKLYGDARRDYLKAFGLPYSRRCYRANPPDCKVCEYIKED